MQGLVTGFLLCGSMWTASISPVFWHAARRQMCDADRCSGVDRVAAQLPTWGLIYHFGRTSLRWKLIPGLRAMVWFYTNRPKLHLDALSWVWKGRNSQVLACHHSLPIFSKDNCPSIQFTFIPISELFHVSLSQCCDRNWLVCSPGSDTVACCLLLLIAIDFLWYFIKKSIVREEEK